VEEAVTTAAVDGDRIERFSRGDRFLVSPEGIERELAALWNDAGRGTHKAVTRACLWNLVVHLEERPEREGGGLHQARTLETLKELPRYLASRTLVLRTGPERAGGGPELESWISANCALSPEGGKVVCSEEITVVSHGAAGEAHLPALVRALLVPDVPTAALFAGVPLRGQSALEDWLRVADRVVLRADASSSPPDAALKRILALGSAAPLGAIDLGWVMQDGLRSLVAELFEPPVAEDAWRTVSEAKVSCRPDSRASGSLALGWLASVLGAKDPRPIAPASWRMSREGAPPLVLRRVEDPSCPLAVSGVELTMAGGRAAVRIPSPGTALLETPGEPPRPARVDKLERAQGLSNALRTRSHDRSFERALAIAVKL
jgi:hypothetical protein